MKKTNILITGCSTGIGKSTAIYLKEQGHEVFASARSTQDVETLKKLGLTAFFIDVRNTKSIEDALAKILEITGGTLDVVFNNAGFGQSGALEDVSTEALKEQFETNVFGLHEVTLQTLEIMKKQGYGKIIQHSSVLGLVSLKLRGAYNASKYAVEGLTDTLRLELEGTNIMITLLNTGPVTSYFGKNSRKKLKENVNIEKSRFKDAYHKNLNAKKTAVPFNLEAIEVAKVVEKILIAKKVKPRYYITKATYILGYLKRILSTSLMDKILIKM
jgi:short-subunit dehydrogenase